MRHMEQIMNSIYAIMEALMQILIVSSLVRSVVCYHFQRIGRERSSSSNTGNKKKSEVDLVQKMTYG